MDRGTVGGLEGLKGEVTWTRKALLSLGSTQVSLHRVCGLVPKEAQQLSCPLELPLGEHPRHPRGP